MTRARTILTAALAVSALAPAAADAARSSLYTGPGPKPGPKLLYAKPAKPAPQLRNSGPWRAKPLLVSGASAYRRGEFLYQDFLYDDSGARGTLDPASPRQGDDIFSGFNGTYTYPSDDAYAQNAADLVELRVKPLRRSTAFRITLNTLKDPGLVATTIAIGGNGAPVEWPRGANVTSPAKLFLLVHGHEAELLRASDGQPLPGPAPRVRVNTRRNQFDVRVPRRSWKPGRKKVRLAAGVGLWDEAEDGYLIPGDSLTETTPGGAQGLTKPTGIFNLAFRFDEAWPEVQDIGTVVTDPAWWREHDQAHALAANDASGFSATVDFAKLRRGGTDLMRGKPGGVPRTGPMNRILSSRFAYGEGVDYDVSCGDVDGCTGQYLGRLQPYAIYVPERKPPRRGYGLTLLLHSLGAMYNQMADSHNQSQFGERGEGHIVISTESRGPDGWYYDVGGAEVFEVWADVARRFRLDPRRAAITGYSMGGYATYKLGTQFPDLFAAGQPTVGPAGLGIGSFVGENSSTTPMLPSLRHVPVKMWVGTADELVPIATTIAHAQAADDAGLRYEFDVFATADHFALAVNDEYGPAADFLGERRVVRNPSHVTYVRNPTMDFQKVKFKADHAYWLSGIRVRDEGANDGLGRVDAVSHGFGRGDAPVQATQNSAGVLTGGFFPAMTYLEQSQAWGKVPKAAKDDKLDLDLTNLSRVRVHVKRARLSCDPTMTVTSDGPVTVVLAGCGRSLPFG